MKARLQSKRVTSPGAIVVLVSEGSPPYQASVLATGEQILAPAEHAQAAITLDLPAGHKGKELNVRLTDAANAVVDLRCTTTWPLPGTGWDPTDPGRWWFPTVLVALLVFSIAVLPAILAGFGMGHANEWVAGLEAELAAASSRPRRAAASLDGGEAAAAPDAAPAPAAADAADPFDVFLAHARARLAEQGDQARSRAKRHLGMAKFFCSRYYAALHGSAVLALMAALCLVFITRAGWAEAGKWLTGIFAVLALSSAFLGIWPSMYEQEENFQQNALKYAGYIGLRSAITTYRDLLAPDLTSETDDRKAQARAILTKVEGFDTELAAQEGFPISFNAGSLEELKRQFQAVQKQVERQGRPPEPEAPHGEAPKGDGAAADK